MNSQQRVSKAGMFVVRRVKIRMGLVCDMSENEQKRAKTSDVSNVSNLSDLSDISDIEEIRSLPVVGTCGTAHLCTNN